MPIAKPDSGETRVIAHLDLDCFYVQVEQRNRPELRGKPVAVVQFNPWKGGGLIAVSYEARECGVLRCMRGDDAKKMCPDIELVQVPTAHGHANVSCYRDAGTEVVEVLSRGGLLERASIDEVYLDLTDAAAARLLEDPPLRVESLSEEARKTHILGLQENGENAMTAGEWLCQTDSPRCDALLACGALIVAELRAAVLAETQFTCSAGIGHNKMLAKLTSSMHKPAQQTVVPASYVPTLLATIPIKKIGHLGGKLGKSLVGDLGVKTPGDLLQFSQLKLQELYGVNTGTWLWNVARGKNGDEVKRRDFAKSHSAGKTFAGRTALTNMDSLMHWLGEMCEELQERLDLDLEMNNRIAKLLVFHAAVHLRGGSQPAKKFPSKSCPIRYGKEKMLADARILFERGLRDFCPPNRSLSPVKGSGSSNNNKCDWAVTSISIGASGMSTIPTGVNPITSFFSAPSRSLASPSPPLTNPSTSALDVSPGQQCQMTEDSGMESIARIPSSNELKETTDFLSDSGYKKSCSSLEPASRDLRPSGDVAGDPDGDAVRCTPTFGSIGSPIRQQKDYSQSLKDDGCNSVLDACINSGNLYEDLEPTLVIRCSPVEEAPISSNLSEAAELSENSCAGRLISEAEVDHAHEFVEKEADPKATTQVVQPRLLRFSPTNHSRRSSSPAGHGSKSTLVPKLKDLWHRKRTASSNINNNLIWDYKEDEVDEEVLAQLPAEIQKELRDALKLNTRPLQQQQQRPTKRPNISDFFPSSSK